ncbi:MAG: Hexaprenyldihydroxybenzoate methyltransferase, mitochondrial [Thelocarpon impressellum]|nr:MAG: Hexaprenyldihydroxybenzoate methyltransferase, mitochondrial [Thelocarpon impressellum]
MAAGSSLRVAAARRHIAGLAPHRHNPRFSHCVPHVRHHTTISSVNPTEVAHFGALASTWWDPHGPSRLLHLMNPLRHDFIGRCLASPPATRQDGLKYLDVGCGGGIFAESAARLPSTASVTAIDPTPEVLAVARAHARSDPSLSRKLTYLDSSIEDLPAPPAAGTYDVLTLFEVLEHVSAPAPFLASCLPHVRPGGWMVLSTISRSWASWATTKLLAEEVLGIVPRGTHEWAQYVNEDELRAWFARHALGWGSARSVGVVYVPGYGWRSVDGAQGWGNYFFGVRRDP